MANLAIKIFSDRQLCLNIPSLLITLLIIYTSTVTGVVKIDWTSIPSPPKLIHEPNDPIIYFTVENTISSNAEMLDYLKERTLRCSGTGNPPPVYTWKKNGKPFNLAMYSDRIAQKPSDGSFVFSRLTADDEGEYQCEVSNDNGTAVSEKIILRQTWIHYFPKQRAEIVKVELGEPYSRNCTPPESNPPARVYWIFKGDEEGSFDSINSSHISTNEEGTIFFHYVKESDFKPNRYYTCTAENTKLKDYKFGSQFSLQVTTNRRRSLSSNVPPAEQYVNQSSPIALNGNTHKLHCFFSGFPEPKPKWYHNGHIISEDNNDGFLFESYGKTLVFNVTMSKAGKYDCKFPAHSDIDRSFNVVVEAAPYWPDQPPANTNTSEGETVVFDCKTSGKPPPVVTFYKNGVEMINPKSGEKWVIDGSKLTIYDVKKGIHGAGDNAVYQCKAENKHGYLWTNFYLNLLAFKPQLLEDSGEVEAVEGKELELFCKFFASPIVNITWESPNLLGIAHEIIPVDPNGVGKLIITNVNEDSEGEYKCIGKNKYGIATGAAKVSVRKPTHLAGFNEPSLVHIAGEVLKLPCSAHHDNRLEVNYEWLVNGKPLDQERLNSGAYEIDSDNTLIIKNPTQYDSAEYVCNANTKLDSASKSIQITIQDVPAPPHAAYITDCNEKDYTVKVNFEHLEDANVISPVKEFWSQYLPDPDVDNTAWRTHPVPVFAEQNEHIENGQRMVRASLTISLKPYGRYVFRVIARNAVGDSSPVKVKGSCETSPKAPFRNPSGVKVQGSQPDNLVVYWNAMPREEWNGPNFGYEIQYKPKSGNQWKTIEVSDPFANKQSIEFDEDRPFEPYEVQVIAKNELGPAIVSPETIEGRTGEGDPGVTPTNFKLIKAGSTTAEFSWDPIDSSAVNGNFTGYQITYWHIDEDDDEYFSDMEDSHKESKSKKRRYIKNNRIKRSFNDESSLKIPNNKKTIIFSPKATSGTVTGLKPNAINYAQIAVLNGQNAGTPTEPISFRTEEGVPTPVRRLGAYPLNNRSPAENSVIMVRWDKPKNLHGNLQHYTVEYCTIDEVSGKVLQCSSPEVVPYDKQEIRLTNLLPDTRYRIKVYGNTNAGDGAPNSVDAKTLSEEVASELHPETPTLTNIKVGEDNINLTFVPGDFDENTKRPVGNSHIVQYREKGNDEWINLPTNDDSLEANIKGLEPGTKYDVQVVAQYTDEDGNIRQTPSRIHHIQTIGSSSKFGRFWWILLILLLILLLLILLCIICLILRQRGQKYPVSEKERLQGREPMLGKDRNFGEYENGTNEEGRSLAGHSQTGSETDSMAEYGDGDPGRFTEDGSFIGQYVPTKTLAPNSDR
ncbi:Neuroglian [Strongyloides ratti]|uniref:Neuroglian n=1 Tax=Strongyloides ratti TaxID=34506 RepID=A0A090LRY8_STRRB|nr:Neuroglian [Strongyloides ratti]CEF70977.1 Neuroglian [Strongyloides ratti]